MGLQQLTIVYYKGRHHIAQYSKYGDDPNQAGLAVLRSISHPDNIAALKEVPSNAATTLYEPAHEQLDAWKREMNAATVCPSMDPCTGAGILEAVKNATAEAPVPIARELEPPADPPHCDWVCAVDLDADALEVYSYLVNAPAETEGKPMEIESEPKETESESRFESAECLREEVLPPVVGRLIFSDLPNEDGFVDAL